MSGHSKWSTIKRQKGATDAKRGQLFTKLTREIMAASREGGGNPELNARLRLAVQKARDNNMPVENVDRAIKRATGEGEDISLTEVTYEGYGPNGTAILMQALTDNRNRTIQEVRSVMNRGGGTLGDSGCVAWIFENRGIIVINNEGIDAEEVALWAIDAGAEDVKIEEDYTEIYTEPTEVEAVRLALKNKGLQITSADVALVPSNTVELDKHSSLQILKLIDKIEGLEDIQRVFTNADLSDAALEEYQFQA